MIIHEALAEAGERQFEKERKQTERSQERKKQKVDDASDHPPDEPMSWGASIVVSKKESLQAGTTSSSAEGNKRDAGIDEMEKNSSKKRSVSDEEMVNNVELAPMNKSLKCRSSDVLDLTEKRATENFGTLPYQITELR